MIHGYINTKEDRYNLLKIDLNTENRLSAFNYNKENNILAAFDYTLNRFVVYNGYKPDSEMIHGFDKINTNYSSIAKILGRTNYIQETLDYKRIVFVYYVFTVNQQLVKFNLYVYLNEERYEYKFLTISKPEYELDKNSEYKFSLLKHTDDTVLVTHDPAFILFDKTKMKLFASSLIGDEINYIYDFEDKDSYTNNNFVLPDSNEFVDKKYLTSYPIVDVNNFFSIFYINYEKNIIRRKLFFESLLTFKPKKFSVEIDSNIMTVTLMNTNEENGGIEKYVYDLLNGKIKTKYNKDFTEKHQLGLNLFFNGGNYLRKDGDKIKIGVKSYAPTLSYPNNSRFIAKNLDTVEAGYTVGDVVIPRIFEDDNKIIEYMKKDITDLSFQNEYSRNRVINSVLGNERILGLISDLNGLDKDTDDYEPVYVNNGTTTVKLIRLKNEEIEKTIYKVMKIDDFKTVTIAKTESKYPSIALVDGKYFGETTSDFIVVQNVGGNKEFLLQPLFIRKSVLKNYLSNARNHILDIYDKNFEVTETNIKLGDYEKKVIRDYSNE